MKTIPSHRVLNSGAQECQALLKPRRGRSPDPCDLVCGGCGKQFNGCEIEKEPR